MITFLSTHFPQAELWRIHKSNINELDASVIEVSDKGRIDTVVESGFIFVRTKRLHAGSAQPTSLRLSCPNVYVLTCLGQMMKKSAITKVIL